MALQGTLDTFSLPDVLRLLASTSKSGCLHVFGGRGAGDVWFQSGAIAAAETTGPLTTTDAVEVLCELLRNVEGHFEFEAGATRDDLAEAAPAEIEPLLAEAEQMVAEWSEIESVVPSLDAWVTLVEELPKGKVTVDAAAWKVIIAVGAGSTVRDIGTWMGLGELAVCRGIRDVVKLGLAEISEAPVANEPTADVSPFDRSDEVVTEVLTEDDPLAGMGVHPDWDNTPPWAEETQWVEDAGYLSHEPMKRANPVYEPFEPLSFDDADAAPEVEVEVEVEVEAVAETLDEALPEVPDDAAEVVAEDDDDVEAEPEAEAEPTPVDRRRLAKFLGSVGK